VRRLAWLVALPALLAACGSTRTVVSTVTVTRTTPPAAGEQRLYGHIRSVAPTPGGYELSFDPAWHLSGITANAAAAADQGLQCAPSACPPVPNDSIVVDESNREYVYRLPADTPGTVLVSAPSGFRSLPVSGQQLARLVGGTSALHLFEPLSSGVWLTVHIDTVRSFVQQYVP
jgi:hypothetical protein